MVQPHSPPWLHLPRLNLFHKLGSCLRFHMADFCFNTTNTIAPWGNAADAAMLPTSAALILFARGGGIRRCHPTQQMQQRQCNIASNLIKSSKVQSERRVSNFLLWSLLSSLWSRDRRSDVALLLIFIWEFARF